MKKWLLTWVALAILGWVTSGCTFPKTEYGPELQEQATVLDVIFVPSQHGTGTGVGPTMSSGGNIGVTVVATSVHIREKYAVVFQCEHGKFIVQGDEKHHRTLWESLSKGQRVTVHYRSVFRVYKQQRTLVKYDFLYVTPEA